MQGVGASRGRRSGLTVWAPAPYLPQAPLRRGAAAGTNGIWGRGGAAALQPRRHVPRVSAAACSQHQVWPPDVDAPHTPAAGAAVWESSLRGGEGPAAECRGRMLGRPWRTFCTLPLSWRPSWQEASAHGSGHPLVSCEHHQAACADATALAGPLLQVQSN